MTNTITYGNVQTEKSTTQSKSTSFLKEKLGKNNIENVIIYARATTDTEEDKLTSLTYQKEQLVQFCNLMGHNIVGSYEEIHSGNSFKERIGFKRLLDFIKKNNGMVQKLLVVNWERLSPKPQKTFRIVNKLISLGVTVNPVVLSSEEKTAEELGFLTVIRTIWNMNMASMDRSARIKAGIKAAKKGRMKNK